MFNIGKLITGRDIPSQGSSNSLSEEVYFRGLPAPLPAAVAATPGGLFAFPYFSCVEIHGPAGALIRASLRSTALLSLQQQPQRGGPFVEPTAAEAVGAAPGCCAASVLPGNPARKTRLAGFPGDMAELDQVNCAVETIIRKGVVK